MKKQKNSGVDLIAVILHTGTQFLNIPSKKGI